MTPDELRATAYAHLQRHPWWLTLLEQDPVATLHLLLERVVGRATRELVDELESERQRAAGLQSDLDKVDGLLRAHFIDPLQGEDP